MTPLQLRVFDFVRECIAREGFSPPARLIAGRLDLPNEGAARYQVDKLVAAGMLIKDPAHRGSLKLPDSPELQLVPTSALRAELARRGASLEALVEDPQPLGGGARCTYEPCGEGVRRGHLFCRPHWHAIPGHIRDGIFLAYRRHDEKAYSAAIEDARRAIERGAGSPGGARGMTDWHRNKGPACRVAGGAEASEVAADLSPWWREKLAELPASDFPQPAWMKAKMLDSALRRGWIERCGYHFEGAWFYRLTKFGRTLQASIESDAA